MTLLTVSGLYKTYAGERDGVRAVEDVSFTVEDGRLYTLLGPSGCGKTTTLRCIAGLERPERGTVTLDDRVLSSSDRFVPPYMRDIGMVFQSYAIWPHMSVFQNVAFPLEVSGPKRSRTQIRGAVEEALALVGLEGLEDRPAPRLSGGQQQRLALARALVGRPSLLLLDEPLSNLDAKLRERMRVELRELQRRIRSTTVYVTHDQGEALFLSHRIGLMNEGSIVQEGSPREVYGEPSSGFAADFVGSATFVAGRCVGGGVEALGGVVICSTPSTLARGAAAILVLRPEDIVVRTTPAHTSNEFAGTLEVAAFLGDHLDCVIAVGGTPLRARVHPATRLRRGQEVWVEVPPDRCVTIPDDGWRPRAVGIGADADTA